MHQFRTCRACRKLLSESAFYQNPRTRKWASECRPCKAVTQRTYNATPEGREQRRAAKKRAYQRQVESRRDRHRQRRYGITPEQFNELFNKQCGVCAICSRRLDLSGKMTCIDHCHFSGEVRGLLCNPCNRALGYVDKVSLESIATYLGLRLAPTILSVPSFATRSHGP